MANVPKAFEIIIQHFSGQTLCKSQEEIYDSVKELDLDEGSEPATLSDIRRTLRYLKDFGLVKKLSQSCWHIKSVDEMCQRLRNSNVRNNGSPLTVSIAFEIIIHDFSDDTDSRSTEKIKEHVFNVHGDQGGHPTYDVKDPIGWTLRFLIHFGFAEKKRIGYNHYWHIKSVDEMCQRLRALVHNRE